MKSNYILSFVFVIVGLVSCKQETGNVQQEPVQDTTTVATKQQSAEEQPSAQPSETGKSSELGHDYTFLTDKLFLFKGSFGGTKSGEQLYKDEWIDLAADGTYKAGKLKEQTHTGKWAYNNDTKVLLLKPDVNTFNITEWKVMYNEQMMVWIGTQTYGNHSTQVQLVRSTDLP